MPEDIYLLNRTQEEKTIMRTAMCAQEGLNMQETSDYPIKWITPDFATCYAPASEQDLNEIRRHGSTTT